MAWASLSGCHRSGTWENDPKNWKRIFGQDPPKEVKVLHSWYWRSPHFTFEFEYFLEFIPDAEFRKNAEKGEGLLHFAPDQPTDKGEEELLQRFFHAKPSWFLPKPLKSYDIRQGKPPRENFRIFIDRETGVAFMTDYSV